MLSLLKTCSQNCKTKFGCFEKYELLKNLNICVLFIECCIRYNFQEKIRARNRKTRTKVVYSNVLVLTSTPLCPNKSLFQQGQKHSISNFI